ncbi:MAG: DUF2852 domain-containing protein [Pseudomonadota bacterium]
MIDTLSSWLRSAEAWLDARGKGAWIAAMVLGFIFVWPVGLAILFYMIWSNRMSCKSRRYKHRRANHSPTGNTAFDEYREETLRRLEEEQTAFHAFMARLRQAKDKAEFEQFMTERRDIGAGDVPA